MKKYLYLPICLCAVIFLTECHQTSKEMLLHENDYLLTTSQLNVKVEFYAEDRVKVTKWLTDTEPRNTSLVVTQTELPEISMIIDEEPDYTAISTQELVVIITKDEGLITYTKPDGTVILKEKGLTEFKSYELGSEKAFSIKQEFELTEGEGLYGLGQHQESQMNYRNSKTTLVQSNTDAVNPFLISTNNYGILWDNYSKTVFEDRKSGASFWSEVADNVEYHFIAGEDMDEVIAGYRELTGKAPMYGKWAFGYWQSKEHYEDRDELLSIAAEYRKRNIPIDNMIQDWDYWKGSENWNQLYFDDTKFPEPAEMIDILHDQNFHVMISIWCSFGPNTKVYQDMEKRGFLYPPVGWAGFKYFDTYNPEANQLFWKYINKGLYSKGIDGWWMDSTEPDIINALSKGATEYEMKRVADNQLGSFARYLNTYTLLSTESVYKNQRKTNNDQRAYILTRSTFAGQQRAGATTWSGDIGASWEIYKDQIIAGVNHSMSGIPYWTFDIGAFFLGGYGGVYTKGVEDPAYQELYTRMFQYGAFCPIFRSHGSDISREIWRFGNFTPSLIKFDNLRYRLMPYIYTLAGSVTQKDASITRGLAMEFPEDKKTYNIDDQFMFGPSMMVCPVTEYMYHREPEKSIVIAPEHFKTVDGKPGINVKYYKDVEFSQLGLDTVEPNIDLSYYSTGRPDYVTDSTLSIHWKGKLVPTHSGKYQLHIKCFGSSDIFLDGKKLEYVYSSTESYTEILDLEAYREYDLEVKKTNGGPGAFRVELYWKTPDMFDLEKEPVRKEKTRNVYLPEGTKWVDFWTGESLDGGQTIVADAPIDKIPIYLKAGSILPMGPFVQYAAEKDYSELEVRIYKGADGSFSLYEDEDDNYNYENGAFSNISFDWDDAQNTLKIGKRKGSFKGMLASRKFKLILVSPGQGNGIPTSDSPDKMVEYSGEELMVQL